MESIKNSEEYDLNMVLAGALDRTQCFSFSHDEEWRVTIIFTCIQSNHSKKMKNSVYVLATENMIVLGTASYKEPHTL